MNDLNGILLVDKPKGLTSQQVLSKIKNILHLRKIGHCGTLDPLSTGLLVSLVGKATKLSDYLLSDCKEYACEILIGKGSDTYDITGKILDTKKVDVITNIDDVLSSFLGSTKQIPPMYSGIKQNGMKLYQLARLGLNVARKARDIEIKEIKRTSPLIYENGGCRFTFNATVSKGTYIRSLCCDIGKKLGYPALMVNLKRLSSGAFSLDDAYNLADIENGNFKLRDALSCVKPDLIHEINKDVYLDVLNGRRIKIKSGLDTVFLSYNNELVGIYQKDGKEYKAKRVWKQ